MHHHPTHNRCSRSAEDVEADFREHYMSGDLSSLPTTFVAVDAEVYNVLIVA
jgi:hypothetical protein